MDSIKIKNFIIIVLLIVNAVLISVFIGDTLRERDMAGGAVDGVESLLSENGIAIAPGVNLAERSLPILELERDTALELKNVRKVLGEVNVTDLGGNILHYSGANGEANFRGTGSFEMRVYDYDSGGADPEAAARAFAERLGLSPEREPLSVSLDETQSGTVELVCRFNGALAANCRLSFTFSGGGIYMVMGTRTLDSVVNETAADCIDVPTTLMRFLSLVNSGGHVCSSVNSLELVYTMSASAAGTARLVPVWLIATDSGSFYIDAVTGREEAMA